MRGHIHTWWLGRGFLSEILDFELATVAGWGLRLCVSERADCILCRGQRLDGHLVAKERMVAKRAGHSLHLLFLSFVVRDGRRQNSGLLTMSWNYSRRFEVCPIKTSPCHTILFFPMHRQKINDSKTRRSAGDTIWSESGPWVTTMENSPQHCPFRDIQMEVL